MNQDVELYDKTIYYQGRVWTIYALSGNQDGVFAYQGLKPYEMFKYDAQSNLNIVFLKMDEALNCIVEGDDRIAECVKNEKIAQAKKLNKKMAVEFFVYLTGHSQMKINSEIQEEYNSFKIVLGQVRYDLFKSDGMLYLYQNIHGKTTDTFFDFVTWKQDSMYEYANNKKHETEYKQEIIEAYKEKYNCSCDRE